MKYTSTLGYLSIILIFTLISCGNSKSPDSKNKRIGNERLNIEANSRETISPSENDLIGSVKIVDFLPQNYSIIGDIDYTSIIQRVLDKNNIVEFPNFPVQISDVGLSLRSNSTLVFKEHSKLKLKSSQKEIYAVLSLSRIQNVTIYSPKIEGDRNRRVDPQSKKGEWGMGIWLSSAKNIKIYNPIINDCWGDGIYIGRGDLNDPNDGVFIHNAQLDNNRRNGISITSGKNIHIIDAIISNTQGTSPEAGIDIEPNNNDDIIDNIFIQNPHTINNGEYGILLILDTMIGQEPKDVNIIIENHLDETSSIAFRVAGYRDKEEENIEKITGNIEIRNSIWKFNKKPFKMENTNNMLPKIKFTNTEIYYIKNNKVVRDSTFLKTKMSEYRNNGVFFN